MSHTCANCGKDSSSRCKRCKQVWYCGKDCQIAHWHGSHVADCDSMISARLPTEEGLEKLYTMYTHGDSAHRMAFEWLIQVRLSPSWNPKNKVSATWMDFVKSKGGNTRAYPFTDAARILYEFGLHYNFLTGRSNKTGVDDQLRRRLRTLGDAETVVETLEKGAPLSEQPTGVLLDKFAEQVVEKTETAVEKAIEKDVSELKGQLRKLESQAEAAGLTIQNLERDNQELRSQLEQYKARSEALEREAAACREAADTGGPPPPPAGPPPPPPGPPPPPPVVAQGNPTAALKKTIAEAKSTSSKIAGDAENSAEEGKSALLAQIRKGMKLKSVPKGEGGKSLPEKSAPGGGDIMSTLTAALAKRRKSQADKEDEGGEEESDEEWNSNARQYVASLLNEMIRGHYFPKRMAALVGTSMFE